MLDEDAVICLLRVQPSYFIVSEWWTELVRCRVHWRINDDKQRDQRVLGIRSSDVDPSIYH